MSSLLLRLFESEHFNISLAINYLKTYPDQIGVTYYLVGRLREFSEADVAFYWPQLCHLLITRPTDSAALESFLMQKCEESTHLAMLSLWYLQASLYDLASMPNTPSFAICRRAFNRVQSIIFTDLIAPEATSATPSTAATLGLVDREKLKPHAKAAFVGLGMLASALALPPLAKSSGQMTIQQGRKVLLDDQGRPAVAGPQEERESSGSEDEEDVSSPRASVSAASSQPTSLLAKTFGKSSTKAKQTDKKSPSFMPGPRLEPSASTSPTKPLQRTRTLPTSPRRLGQSTSLSHLPRWPSGLPASPLAASRSNESPPNSPPSSYRAPSAKRLPSRLNSTSESNLSLQAHSASVPSFSQSYAASTANLAADPSQAAALAASAAAQDVERWSASMPKQLLVNLLRAHACRAQLDLLTSLQDISTRLVSVPKMARISALRAELTVLNHGLPRGCCLGMFCPGESSPTISSDDSTRSKPSSFKSHHRIVRISPSESVVLNSADRAPFLIHVEVLEGDLDFDPSRRQNYEDLRTVLTEREGSLAKASYRSGSTGFASGRSVSGSTINAPQRSNTERPHSHSRVSSTRSSEGSQRASTSSQFTSPPSSAKKTSFQSNVPVNGPSLANVAEPEEMDMVEQLYGDTSVRDAPAVATEFIPPVIHNRSVDEQAWKRSHSTPASPALGKDAAPAFPGPKQNEDRKPITLDEYAERMRMAAIMLSQLNASQQTPMGMVQNATGAAGGLVNVGIGLGAGIGGAMGYGFDAVRGVLPFSGGKQSSIPGQGSSGLAAALDTASANAGFSAVSGSPNLSTFTTSTPIPAPSPTLGQSSGAARQRVLPPTEAAAIKERIMTEMMALEEERMDRMRADSRARSSGWTANGSFRQTPQQRTTPAAEDEGIVMSVVNKEDPSGAVFSESWAEKRTRIRSSSPYGHLANWDVLSVIVKTGTDLRQEQLATQLIQEFGKIWSEVKCPHWVRYFRMLVTSESTGLIETITDAVSVHSIKKDAYSRAAQSNDGFVSFTLYDHFVEKFGEPDSSAFRRAQDCFMKSLASYSIICYILQIKDRHNGNILIDKQGHIIHIDFGFLLSNSPGQLGFEMAPFKLPQEYIDILGGMESQKYAEFRLLLRRTFWDVRKHAERIIMIVELMQKDSRLPCFALGDQTLRALRDRFQLSLTQPQCDEFVDRLLDSSALSVITRLYDMFQFRSQGIL